MTDNNKKLGYLIKIARRERMMTQEELAKKVKTKQSGIARAEIKGCELKFAERVLNKLGYEVSNISLRSKDSFASGLTFYS